MWQLVTDLDKKSRGLALALSLQADSVEEKRQLLWLDRQTRPDNAFDAATISSKIKTSTIENLKKFNDIERKVQHDLVLLFFQNFGQGDASFKNLQDGDGQSGYFVFLMGDDVYSDKPVEWRNEGGDQCNEELASKKLNGIRLMNKSPMFSQSMVLED
ncbi:unnamed protein product [Mytilus edulis]|uniref:Uncharacterized protein n=1 Tax=Mytilus edulis TaxID=6550 RepID=A0A8S3U1H3_MYTED|nr:unnamed protein product [Mytilus edulis]